LADALAPSANAEEKYLADLAQYEIGEED